MQQRGQPASATAASLSLHAYGKRCRRGLERSERAQRLTRVSHAALWRDRLAYGMPEMVVERLEQWRDALGLSGAINEPNIGGYIARERVFRSVCLLAQEVIPKSR